MLENFLQTKPPSSKSTRKMSNEFGSSSVTSLAASIEADQLQDVQPREKFPQTRCPVRSAAKNSNRTNRHQIVGRDYHPAGNRSALVRAGALFALDGMEMSRKKTKEMNRHG